MEVFVWLFAGALLFVSWVVLVTYRSEEREQRERQLRLRRRRETTRRPERESRPRPAPDPGRPGPASGRAKKSFAEPEVTSGEIAFEGAAARPAKSAARGAGGGA